MLQLPNPVQDATYYADVNLKRLLSWLGYTLAITAMTFVLCLLTSGIGFSLFLSIWTIVSFFLSVHRDDSTFSHAWHADQRIELCIVQNSPMDGLYVLFHTLGTLICLISRLQIILVILMLIASRKQGLVDLILGTVILNAPAHYQAG